MAKKKNQNYNYHIYAVIDTANKMVFVGESINPNETSILSKHRKGQISCTDWEFGDNPNLEFIMLDIVNCKSHEVLKHILAWAHFFEILEFELLMPEYRLALLENLKDDTISIFQKNCEQYTLDEIRTRNIPIPEVAISTPTVDCNDTKLTQLNVRVTPDTISAFREYCAAMNITQSQGLSILLNLTDCSDTDAYSSHITSLTKQNQSLKEKIDAASKERKSNSDKYHNKYNATSTVLSDIVHYITKELPTDKVHPNHISPCSFAEGQLYHEFDSYQYPSQAGAIEITLQDIVRNKSNRTYPLFLLVTDSHDRNLKFRYYPRTNFAGIAPYNEGFAINGSKWLYGFTLSDDGAADLIASIPLEYTSFEEKLSREIAREIEANRSELEYSSSLKGKNNSEQYSLDSFRGSNDKYVIKL